MSARLGAIVAGCLGGVLLLCVVAIAGLAGVDKTVPGILENLASGALGALAALLARVGGADEVKVVNPPHQPVPVDPEAGHSDAVLLMVGLLVLVVILAVLGVI